MYVFVLFLSERDIIAALVETARRGAAVTVILDQNRVSFGKPKSGFPNQFVAAELARKSHIMIRWANTQEEEFHSKFILVQKRHHCIFHVGSANLTRRSLSNTNLEANVRVEAPTEARVCQDALQYACRLAREPFSIPAGRGNPSPPEVLVVPLHGSLGHCNFLGALQRGGLGLLWTDEPNDSDSDLHSANWYWHDQRLLAIPDDRLEVLATAWLCAGSESRRFSPL